jgi:cell division protein FtsW (lipid II flippase)
MHISVGNLGEALGAGCAVAGVWLVAGLGWALILSGVVLVVLAELVYDAHVWHVALPYRPEPARRWREIRERWRAWRQRLAGPVVRWRARRSA